MTESPSGRGEPEHDSEAALLTQADEAAAPSVPADPPVPAVPSVPGQPTRDDIEADAPEAALEAAPVTADEVAEDETSTADHRSAGVADPLRRLGGRILDELLDPSPGLLLSLLYIGGAVFLTWKLLLHPKASLMAGNPYDQQYFEWQLTAVEHAILHFHNPLFTHTLNAPYGMNLVGNPQIIGPATVLTPVTALFGSSVSFALLTVFNLAATAVTWRWFLHRYVVRTQTAAFVGGLFLGFSPSMISHSLAHPNLAGQWLMPLIAAAVLRLREPGRSARNGIILGLLIVAQVFVGEELLFLTAMGTTLFLVAYVIMRPGQVLDEAGTFLRGAGVAVMTAGVLLAYPLTFQFYGPMSFKGIPFGVAWYSADLKSYAVWPNLELWGDPQKLDPLLPGNTEQAAVFGWVLLLVVALLVVGLMVRRTAVALALVAAGLMLVWLSVGPTPVFNGKRITWWPVGPQGLWTHLQNLPLFSSSLPIRSAIAVSWILGILLAMGLDEAVRHRWIALRAAACTAVAVALVPLLPRVFDTWPRAPIPDYFTSSAWKECVSPGRDTIVGVPLSDGGDRTNLTWSTAADTGFAIPQGPFMAPFSATDKQVTWSTPDGNMLWTAHWLKYIYTNGGGATPPVDASIRTLVRQDLDQWQAKCVVAADGSQHLADIKSFLDQAIAPGVLEGGVVVWKEPVS